MLATSRQSTAGRLRVSSHRGGSSEAAPNVSQIERIVSGVAGVALTALGAQASSAKGLAVAAAGGALIYRGLTGECSLYRSLGVDTAAGAARGTRQGALPREYFSRGIHVRQTVTINRSPWDLYQYWRKLDNLPSIMGHLESVQVIDSTRSHWKAKAPAGMTVEWDAEIINDEPNALIAWRSLAGASVDNAGSVRFVPGIEGRGTQVHVVLDYIPPAGIIGSWVARLFGEEPSAQVRSDLHRFQQLMETGEVATTEGQPRGSCS